MVVGRITAFGPAFVRPVAWLSPASRPAARAQGLPLQPRSSAKPLGSLLGVRGSLVLLALW